MNILVINGSPAGDNSITLQTMLYIEKHFPEHEYVQLNAGQRIRSFEKDFSEAAQALAAADLLLFCYPVYTFLVPAQLHRFIELIKENGVDLRGKYATQITTSKHFYDITAHTFIEENCADLGMKVLHGLSADMDDLLKDRGRHEAMTFFARTLWAVRKGLRDDLPAAAVRPANAKPGDEQAACAPDSPTAAKPKKAKKKLSEGRIVIVTDLAESNTSLAAMIRRFRAVSP